MTDHPTETAAAPAEQERLDIRDARLRDALTAAAAEVFNARARAKDDPNSAYGKYCKSLRDGWKHQAT